MKKIIYLFVLSISITSCSETYVNGDDLEKKEGIFTFNGEKYNGSALGITRKNKVRELGEIKNGVLVKFEEYDREEGKFEELELNDGTKTYISDMLIFSKDCNYEIEYYPNGSVKTKCESLCKDGNLLSAVSNGKKEYFDEEGNITKVEYYENNKKVN
jgi:hypothetical protein